MKFFLIDTTYNAPIAEIDQMVNDHRAFLQKGYEEGVILFSGPKEPRVGGLIVARSESLETLRNFFLNDPFVWLKLATYTYIEFNPVKRQPVLENWFSGS